MYQQATQVPVPAELGAPQYSFRTATIAACSGPFFRVNLGAIWLLLETRRNEFVTSFFHDENALCAPVFARGRAGLYP